MNALKRVVISVALVICLAFSSPLTASAASGNTLLARIMEPNQVTRITAITGGAPAQILYELPESLSYLDVRYSPDLGWVAAYGIDPATQRAVFAYRRANGAPIAIPLAPEAAVLPFTFDEASRHLLYGSSTPDGQFTIGILRLADGVRRELTGSYRSASPFGQGLAAYPMALFGETLYLQAYTPFSDGFGAGIFSLDLTPYTFAATGRYPILEVRRLLGAGEYYTPIFSPNGRYAAMLYNEPANPPANYIAQGPGFSVNAVAVLDLRTGVARRVAAAGAGQGLEHLSWLPDGTTLLFTGGNYNGADRLAAPDFYVVSASTGQVSALGATFAGEDINDLQVCGGRVYVLDGAALRSAATNNLSDVQTHYADASVMLLGCTAR
jgi:hypothetical protein